MLDWLLGSQAQAQAAEAPKPLRKYHTSCVPESIMSAWTWGQKGHKTRIAIQRLDEYTDHAQAQAEIDGVWTPLTPAWDAQAGRIAVTEHGKHFPVEPYRYLGLEEWIQEQLQYTKPKEDK